MKFIGFLLVVVGFCAMEQGGGITFTLLAMIVGGLLCLFPSLVGVLFEETAGERK